MDRVLVLVEALVRLTRAKGQKLWFLFLGLSCLSIFNEKPETIGKIKIVYGKMTPQEKKALQVLLREFQNEISGWPKTLPRLKARIASDYKGPYGETGEDFIATIEEAAEQQKVQKVRLLQCEGKAHHHYVVLYCNVEVEFVGKAKQRVEEIRFRYDPAWGYRIIYWHSKVL